MFSKFGSRSLDGGDHRVRQYRLAGLAHLMVSGLRQRLPSLQRQPLPGRSVRSRRPWDGQVPDGQAMRFLHVADVRKLGRARLQAIDGRARLHLDGRRVERFFTRRYGKEHAKKLGDRAIERKRLYARIRTTEHAHGRHERWRALADEFTAVGEPASLIPGLVALRDWQERPEDWPRDRYPASKTDPGDFQNGRVRELVRDRVRKALQKSRKNS